MSRYIDEYRGRFGVEPMCRTLGVSTSAYYHRKTGRRSRRSLQDERLLGRIREPHAAYYYAYGSRIALNRDVRVADTHRWDQPRWMPASWTLVLSHRTGM